jgi:hypothetical protein
MVMIDHDFLVDKIKAKHGRVIQRTAAKAC